MPWISRSELIKWENNNYLLDDVVSSANHICNELTAESFIRSDAPVLYAFGFVKFSSVLFLYFALMLVLFTFSFSFIPLSRWMFRSPSSASSAPLFPFPQFSLHSLFSYSIFPLPNQRSCSLQFFIFLFFCLISQLSNSHSSIVSHSFCFFLYFSSNSLYAEEFPSPTLSPNISNFKSAWDSMSNRVRMWALQNPIHTRFCEWQFSKIWWMKWETNAQHFVC